MKKIIPTVFAVMLSASPAAAQTDEDVADFAARAGGMGKTTAVLRACSFNDKAEAFHHMIMEEILSLLSTHQDKVPDIIENYEGGIAEFEAVSAGQGPPPSDLCQELLDLVAEYGLDDIAEDRGGHVSSWEMCVGEFISAIINDAKPRMDLYDALHITAIGWATEESMRTGKCVDVVQYD